MSLPKCEHPRIGKWWRHGLFTERTTDPNADIMVRCGSWDGCCPTVVRVPAADLPDTGDIDVLVAFLHERLAAAHPVPLFTHDHLPKLHR